MFPDFAGWKRCSSHPRCDSLPRRQSCVRHEAQADGSRTRTSSGEASDDTKWNCPIGQMCLQNAAPLKNPSTKTAAPKYAMMIQAVHHGVSHNAKNS